MTDQPGGAAQPPKRAPRGRRRLLIDALIALPLVAAVLVITATEPGWQALGLICAAALAWRRTATMVSATVVFVTALTLLLVSGSPLVAAITLPLMLYTVAALGGRRTAWGLGVATLIGTVATTAVVTYGGSGSDVDGGAVATSALLFGFVAAAAAFVGLLRRLDLARRQARVDRDQQVTALAVATERGRIAREVHDIVAHSLAVMIAQADAARLTVDADPAGAGERMSAVADSGRRALGDIRETLRALRDGPDAGLTLSPRPTLERLADLTDAARAAGLATRLERWAPDPRA